MSERSDNPPTILPGQAPAAVGSTIATERRTEPRFPFTATAEIFEINTQTRVMGRIADLSAGGCYIDTIAPLAAGAVVRVSLKRDADEFVARAIVRYALASMGMGLTFTVIKPEHQSVLQKWMSELNGERAAEPESSAAHPADREDDAIVNLRQGINSLINMLVRKKIMSGAEAAELMRQMFR